jgi:hypothetical protein
MPSTAVVHLSPSPGRLNPLREKGSIVDVPELDEASPVFLGGIPSVSDNEQFLFLILNHC